MASQPSTRRHPHSQEPMAHLSLGPPSEAYGSGGEGGGGGGVGFGRGLRGGRRRSARPSGAVEAAGRLAELSAALLAAVLLAAYGAHLVATLAFAESSLPFRDWRGLLQHGGYRFSVTAHSGQLTQLMESQDATLQALYRRFVRGREASLPRSSLHGLGAVCRDSQPRRAHMVSLIAAKGMQQRLPCLLAAIPQDSIVETLSGVMRLNCPYSELLAHRVLQLRENGLLAHAYRRVVSPGARAGAAAMAAAARPARAAFRSATASDAAPAAAVALLVTGAAAALLALAVERVACAYSRRVRTRPVPYRE